MTEKTLREQINIVVEARERMKEALEAKSTAYLEWANKNQELIVKAAATVQQVSDAEATLRKLTLKAYEETGNKAPAPGIGIRVRTMLGYILSDAMAWALEHKLALKLDSSAFEKIAKTSNLPFVTITEEPTATIATELAKVEKEK